MPAGYGSAEEEAKHVPAKPLAGGGSSQGSAWLCAVPPERHSERIQLKSCFPTLRSQKSLVCNSLVMFQITPVIAINK